MGFVLRFPAGAIEREVMPPGMCGRARLPASMLAARKMGQICGGVF